MTNTTRTKKLIEGTNGNGNTCYGVVTIALDGATVRRAGQSVPVPAGRQIHCEWFDTKAEAENWLKWA